MDRLLINVIEVVVTSCIMLITLSTGVGKMKNLSKSFCYLSIHLCLLVKKMKKVKIFFDSFQEIRYDECGIT